MEMIGQWIVLTSDKNPHLWFQLKSAFKNNQSAIQSNATLNFRGMKKLCMLLFQADKAHN